MGMLARPDFQRNQVVKRAALSTLPQGMGAVGANGAVLGYGKF